MRLRVLAIAHACSPTKGSEEAVGWGWVSAIARRHEVTVITADYNEADIERQRCSHPNLRVQYVRNHFWHYRPHPVWRRIETSLAKPLMNLSYQNWLKHAAALAKRELELSPYKIVHLITYVGWRFPGTFYRLGVPFVWGPIGGLMNTPWRLLPALGLQGAVYYGARNLVNSFQLKTLRGPRRALQAAGGAVIAATSEIQQGLWEHFKSNSRVICEVGPPDLPRAHSVPRERREPLRISWSGMHVPGKALHLLLRAAASLPPALDYRLEILGDGPSSPNWRALANRLGIAGRCRWHGWVPRDQSLDVMRQTHVFVTTSLKELTSTVAVEAVSLGVPVICLDHCGLADLVTADCGIKVRVGTVEEIVAQMAAALLSLYRDEKLRQRLAQGAALRAEEYSWEKKMDALDEVYSSAIERAHERCC